MMTMRSATQPRLYEFGPYRLDLGRQVLLRDNQIIPLTPKALETLAILVQNNGQLVEKDHLMREIWPDTFVEEGSLTRNISVLRKTLGEGPSDHQYIQTVPRRGYRFVAGVREVEAVDAPEPLPYLPPAVAAEDGSFPPVAPLAQETPARPRRTHVGWLALALTVALAGGALTIYGLIKDRTAAAPAPALQVTRFTHTGKSIDAAISPDGKYVAHVMEDEGKQSLWVRQTATGSNVQVVPPADVSYQGLAFSRDGNHIFYNLWNKKNVGVVYRVPALGGQPTKVIHDVMPGLAIAPDDRRIAFVRSNAKTNQNLMMVADADGGNERVLLTRDGPRTGWFKQAAWSPDGKTLACIAGAVGTEGVSYMQVITVPAEGGAEKPISPRTWQAINGLAWLPDGNLLMTASDNSKTPLQLWRLSYPGGEARQLASDPNGLAGLSVTADGRTLVTVQGDGIGNVWVTPAGDTAQARKITSGRYEGMALAWAPDGRVVYVSQATGDPEIWVMDADGGNKRQLTHEPGMDFEPSVTPDGKYIIFVSTRGGAPHVWRMDIDGGNPTQLSEGAGEWSPDTSPDGRWVIYVGTKTGKHGLWKVPIAGGESVQLSHRYAYLPAVSPDGRQVAYSYWDEAAEPQRVGREVITLEGGQRVKSFELPTTAVGSWSGVYVRWSPDGRALTYVDHRGGVSNVWSLPLDGGPPRPLTDFKDAQIFWFAWSPDGKRLAVSRGTVTNDVVMVSNFTQSEG